MRFDTALCLENLNEAPALARQVEMLGLDGIWAPDANNDPFLPLTLAAEHTRQAILGTCIAIAFLRSPTSMAATAWDLARQSGGRFILGLGTSVKVNIERRYGIPWHPPVPWLREYIGALRAIWETWQSGAPLNVQGAFYQINHMPPFFSPPPLPFANPRIPIFIAGVNEPLCRLAGEVADGFWVHPLHSPAYLREVVRPAIAAGAARVGRLLPDFTYCKPVFAVTNDAERWNVRKHIAFYCSTRSYFKLLEWHGWPELGPRCAQLSMQGRWDDMGREITDEMLETFAVLASPTDLPEKLASRYEGLLDRVILLDTAPFQPGTGRDDLLRALVEACHARPGRPHV